MVSLLHLPLVHFVQFLKKSIFSKTDAFVLDFGPRFPCTGEADRIGQVNDSPIRRPQFYPENPNLPAHPPFRPFVAFVVRPAHPAIRLPLSALLAGRCPLCYNGVVAVPSNPFTVTRFIAP